MMCIIINTYEEYCQCVPLLSREDESEFDAYRQNEEQCVHIIKDAFGNPGYIGWDDLSSDKREASRGSNREFMCFNEAVRRGLTKYWEKKDDRKSPPSF